MMEQPRRKPRDDEEAAAFKGMGHAITVIRERRGMSREEVAERCDLTPEELKTVELGDLDESWGVMRRIAKALGMSLPALMTEAEEAAASPGGEAWRRTIAKSHSEGAMAADAVKVCSIHLICKGKS